MKSISTSRLNDMEKIFHHKDEDHFLIYYHKSIYDWECHSRQEPTGKIYFRLSMEFISILYKELIEE